MISLNEFSTENLERIQKVLKIVLDELELQGINRLTGNKIPLKRFEKEGFSYEETKELLYGINDKHDIISINNDYLKEKYEEIKIPGTPGNKPLLKTIYNVSLEDFKNYLLITIKDLNQLKEIKKRIDKIIKEKKEKQETKTSRFNKETLKTEQLLDKLESNIKEKEKIKGQKQFEVKVKDREIWINDYFLSKPHAVGSNLEFFEYIRNQIPNIKIERKNLSSQFDNLSLREQIKNKSFIKILNELGFKGEILKAFFPKRGKNMLIYRSDKITKKDLEKAGVKMLLFIKELELAHLRNSPE